jgi:hypothetical protein
VTAGATDAVVRFRCCCHFQSACCAKSFGDQLTRQFFSRSCLPRLCLPACLCTCPSLPACLQLSEMKALIGYFDLDPNRCFRWGAAAGSRAWLEGHAFVAAVLRNADTCPVHCTGLLCCSIFVANFSQLLPCVCPALRTHLAQPCSGCLHPAAQQRRIPGPHARIQVRAVRWGAGSVDVC